MGLENSRTTPSMIEAIVSSPPRVAGFEPMQSFFWDEVSKQNAHMKLLDDLDKLQNSSVGKLRRYFADAGPNGQFTAYGKILTALCVYVTHDIPQDHPGIQQILSYPGFEVKRPVQVTDLIREVANELWEYCSPEFKAEHPMIKGGFLLKPSASARRKH